MVNVVVLDMRSPNASDVATAALVYGWHVVRVTPQQDLDNVARRAVEAAAPHTIRSLRFMAHGVPGEMQIGMGLHEDSACQLEPLRGHITDGLLGTVWCFACSTGAAAGPDQWHKQALLESGFGGPAAITAGRGYRLLRAMALTLGRNVTAPIDRQFMGGWRHQDFFSSHVRFGGTRLEVSPHGAYRVIDPDGSAFDATDFS